MFGKMQHNIPAVLGLLAAGCVTPGEKKEIKQDLFNLQTRTIQLENLLRDREADLRSTGDAANKRIASTATEMDRLQHEIQVLQGEIDALKVGVRTGALPGSNPEEESVAQTLSAIVTRLEAVEGSQAEILESLEKLRGRKNTGAAAKPAAGATASDGSIDKDFAAKNYQAVADQAPNELKATTNKSKQQKLLYYYAESLFHLKKTRDAALKFNEYLESGGTKYAAQAKLRLGDCFVSLGDSATAKLYYEELVKEFPGTAEAKRAQQALGKLGAKGAARKGSGATGRIATKPDTSKRRTQ